MTRPEGARSGPRYRPPADYDLAPERAWWNCDGEITLRATATEAAELRDLLTARYPGSGVHGPRLLKALRSLLSPAHAPPHALAWARRGKRHGVLPAA